jgi:ATP-dependent helicase/nuclease subunit A
MKQTENPGWKVKKDSAPTVDSAAVSSFIPPISSVPPWTSDQLAAIRHVESDLLVSAAAGSGKTAVLAERCAWLVCDAPKPCEVDQMLVVTFTEAAAAEMKERIGAALRRRLSGELAVGSVQLAEADPEAAAKRGRLVRQIALLDRASISTLHAFCATLIRRHHAQLGLDPGFKILDGDEAELLKREVVKEVFEGRYDGVEGTKARRQEDMEGRAKQEDSSSLGAFSEFIDDYGDGSDEGLREQVVAAHELLQSVVDPQAWRAMGRRRLTEGADRPLGESELGQALMDMVRGHLEALRGQCARAGKIIAAMPGFEGYAKLLREWYLAIRHWQGIVPESGSGFRVSGSGVDHVAAPDPQTRNPEPESWLWALAEEVVGVEWPKLPPIKKDVAGKDLAKGLMDDLKAALKEGPLVQLLKFSEEQWRQGLREILPCAELFLDLVEEFSQKYSHAKRARQSLDFSDLERFALKALMGDGASEAVKGHIAPAAADCRRQFRHVLVDEYQDINQVQDAILSAVTAENKDEQGNDSSLLRAFYVGDVKQSIYRFRLAEPRRFLERQERFRRAGAGRGRVIDLQKNFRSRGPLLGAINAVFGKLMTAQAAEIEYDASHFLHPGADFSQAAGAACFSGAPIELHLLPELREGSGAGVQDSGSQEAEDEGGEFEAGDTDRTEREALLIARRIQQMMGRSNKDEGGSSLGPMQVQDKEGTTRPIECRDIVILLRSLKHKAGTYADVLRQSGIPAHTDSGGDFFQSQEVRDVMALLRVLDNQQQDVPLAAVLRSPLAGKDEGGTKSPSIPHPSSLPGDLAAIRLAYMHEAEPPAFCQAVARYAAEREDELALRLRTTLERIGRWRELTQRRPLAEVIWTIYQESGYLAYMAGLHNGRQRVANLMHLHRRAQQFGRFERQGLFRFLRFLDQLAQRLEQPSVASAAEDAVRIMSIHSAKGLEFPVVFLADLGKKFNMKDAQGSILLDRREGLGLKVADAKLRVRYPSLAWTILNERIRRQSLAEELRLLYVAMTRAREHLICVGTGKKDSGVEAGRTNTEPLPPEMILSAHTPLDWLVPVAAQLTNENTFDVTAWTAEQVGQWPTPRQMRPVMDEWQRDRAALKPLDPPPMEDAAAREVMERLTVPYAYEPFTQVAAAVAATSMENGKWKMENEEEGPHHLPFTISHFPSPPKAADRGTAFHEVLRFLDFSRACDEADVREQIEAMVGRHQVSREQARQVEAGDVCWLMETAAGRLLKQYADRLWRELPFIWARPPAGLSPADPLDRQIVRGRVDVLIPTDEGLVLLDYKTDRVRGERLEERVASYRPQLSVYAEALAEVTGQAVAGGYLVFLTAREVRKA